MLLFLSSFELVVGSLADKCGVGRNDLTLKASNDTMPFHGHIQQQVPRLLCAMNIFDSGGLLSLLYDAQEFERWCEFQTHDENIMRIDTQLDWIVAWDRKVTRKTLQILLTKKQLQCNYCLRCSPFQQQWQVKVYYGLLGSLTKPVIILVETGILGGGTCHIASGTAHRFRLGRQLLSRFGSCCRRSTWGFERVNVDSISNIFIVFRFSSETSVMSVWWDRISSRIIALFPRCRSWCHWRTHNWPGLRWWVVLFWIDGCLCWKRLISSVPRHNMRSFRKEIEIHRNPTNGDKRYTT